MPGNGTTNTALAATSIEGSIYPNNSLHLFCRGIGDRHIYVNTSHDGNSWSGWRQVPGLTTNVIVGTRPGDANESAIYLIGVREDNRIVQNHCQSNLQSFEGWVEVPGEGRTNAAPSFAYYYLNFYPLVKGINNFVYIQTSHAKWYPVPGRTTDVAPESAHGGRTGFDEERLYLFIKDAQDNRIYMNAGHRTIN